MRRQLHNYQAEIRRLKEAAGELQSHLVAGERLDALLSSMHESVFRLDGSSRVVAANPRAMEIFSLSESDFPLSLRQFYRDADWHGALQHALAALPKYTCLPDMYVSDHVLTPRLAQLEEGQALLLCMDITEQHRLEKQRRTFLSNLLHDLKTPLTSLLGYARSMESFGNDADFRKEAAQVIADEAKHVNYLLDALLTLDQIEFSCRDKNAVCEPEAVMKQVHGILKPRLRQKSVKLDKQFPSGKLRLAMAADDLERVLTNILENAVRHSPEKGRIRIQLAESNQQCIFVIEDEGPGIPDKKLSKVTERFYRVDKARGRQSGNHGLGLAIVKELVELYDGSLSLSNISPHGLRVGFSLPMPPESREQE
jgi:two-component system phosphate regulon sensor histidine kinase PhoR